jgi:hypothetical protein
VRKIHPLDVKLPGPQGTHFGIDDFRFIPFRKSELTEDLFIFAELQVVADAENADDWNWTHHFPLVVEK